MGTPFSNRELIRRIRWYVAVRWFYVLAIGIIGNLAYFLSYNSSLTDQLKINIGIVVLICVINGLFMAATYVHVKMSGFYELLSVFQIVFDLVIMTLLFEFNSGIETPLVMLYCIPILMSGVLLSRVAVYCTGIVAAVLFVTLTLLDYLNILRPQNIDAIVLHSDASSLVPTMVTTAVILLVVTVIADFVSTFVRRSTWLESELRGTQQEIDKAEVIIDSLPSALMLVDASGKITQVNQAFERLMAWSEARVIGKKATMVLKLVDTKGKPAKNIERTLYAVLGRKQLPLQPVPYYLEEHAMRRKNGTTFRYWAQISAIVSHGRLAGAMIVFDERADDTPQSS